MDSQILAAQAPRAELLRGDRQPTRSPSRPGAELLHVDRPPIHTHLRILAGKVVVLQPLMPMAELLLQRPPPARAGGEVRESSIAR